MASNNINVNLLFQADTTAALRNIQQLAATLNSISKTTTVGVSSGPIAEAAAAARELQVHLDAALNTNTGKLDLTKLNSSLAASKTSLMDLGTKLQAIGPQGQQAFMRLATAVSSAETPMVRLSARTKEFMTTLANTAKWQIASTAIHTIQGGLSEAISHAKDLNRALTDIRIVTGYSQDYMANFAKEANAAAKALNTTSTEYAKASLIFFQQGLSGDAVSERAEVVIKLSQVTGQSADQVSDQMTAIWNNFQDGSKSLEYYADAIAKLGAATAASTDEIVDGVEKFAAVAETAGLSYEYATAALATVVDKTKQSPEVIGTAFKTIFARIQGLKLGETLEDGTDLNKYSEALMAVGVNIKDAEGNIKDLDTILDELGSKWKTLSKDTQLAVAQTVGGLRQYNQMIALMDNWEDVKINVGLAESAEGTLQEQVDTWAEGIDGAAERLQQAKNELFENFLDDKSVVNITNIFADLISTVDKLIDSFGGFGPMLLTIGALFSKTLMPMMLSGFQRITQSIYVMTGAAQKKVLETQNAMRQSLISTRGAENNQTIKDQIDITLQLGQAKQDIADKMRNATAVGKEELSLKLKIIEALGEEALKNLEVKQALEERIATEKAAATQTLRRSSFQDIQQQKRNVVMDSFYDKKGMDIEEKAKVYAMATDEKGTSSRKLQTDLKNKTQELKQAKENSSTDTKVINNLEKEIQKINEVINLRKELRKARQVSDEDVNNFSYGETQGFMTPEDADVKKGSQSMAKAQAQDIANQLGGGKADLTPGGEGVTADASLNNLEKIIELKTKYAGIETQASTASKEFNSVLQTQQQAQKKVNKLKSQGVKSGKQLAKAEQDLMKANEQVQKTTGKMSKSLLALAKESKMSGNQLNSFQKVLQGVAKQDPAALKQLPGYLEKIMGAASNSKNGLDVLGQEMIELLRSSDLTDDQLNTLVSLFERLGAVGTSSSNGVNNFKKSLDGINNNGFGQWIGTTLTGIGALAGQFQMLMSSIQMIKAAFDEDASAGERFQSALMGISMLLPSIVSIYGSFNLLLNQGAKAKDLSAKATKKDTEETKKNTIATKGNMAADTEEAIVEGVSAGTDTLGAKTKDKDTKSTILNTAMTWLGVKAKMAWLAVTQNWVALSLATAAIVGLGWISTQNETEAVEENTEAKEENAKSLKEILDIYNEFDSVNEKFSEFAEGTKEWNEALDKTHESLKALYEYLLTIDPEKAKEFLGDIKLVGGRWTMSDEDMEKYAPIFEEKNREQKVATSVAGAGGYSQRKHERETYGDAAWSDTEEFKINHKVMEGLYDKWKEASAVEQEELLQNFFAGNYVANQETGAISEIGTDAGLGYNITYSSSKDQNEIRKWLQEKNAIDYTDKNMGIIAGIQASGVDLGDYSDTDVLSYFMSGLRNPAEQIVNDEGKLTDIGIEAAKKFAINAGYAKTEDDIEVTLDSGGKISLQTKDAEGNKTEVGTTDVKELQDVQKVEANTESISGGESVIEQHINTLENFGAKGDANNALLEAFKAQNIDLLTEDQMQEIVKIANSGQLPTELLNFLKDTSLANPNQKAGVWDDNFVVNFDQKKHDQALEEQQENRKSEAAILARTEAESLGFEDEEVDQTEALAKAYLDMAEAGEEGTEAIKGSAEAAKDAAIRYQRLQKGVIDLSENIEDYKGILKDIQNPDLGLDEKEFIAASKGAKQLKSSLADVLNVSDDMVDIDLLSAINPSDLEAAAQGNEAAIGRIRDSFIRLQVEGVEGVDLEGLKAELADFTEGQIIDIDETPLLNSLIQAKLAAGASALEIEQMLSGIGIDANVESFEGSMEEMKAASAEAGVAVIENTSFTQEVDTVTAEAEDTTDIPTYYEKYDVASKPIEGHNKVMSGEGDTLLEQTSEHYPVTKSVVLGESVPVNEKKQTTGSKVSTSNAAGKKANIPAVKITNANKSVGNSVANSTKQQAISNVNNGSGSGKGGGNGGGSGSKPNKPHEKSEKAKDNKVFRPKIAKQELDRFADETQLVDKLQRSIDKVGRTKEEAWGSDYIKAIDDENELLRQEVKIYEDLENEAKKFREEDLQKAREAGLNIEVDAEGNIINREAVDKQIFDLEQDLEKRKIEWENAQNIAQDAELNGLLTNDDATNEKRDAVNKKYEDAKREQEKLWEEEEYNIEITKGWLENYDESHEKVLEAQEAREEALMKIRSNNLEKLSQKYEQLIDLQDRELEIIDTMKSRISDSFTDAPEFFSLMGQEFSNFTDKGEAYTQQMAEALRMFGAGEISKAGLMESLDTVWDGTSEHIQDLISWSEEMKESYANFLSDFRDQIDTASEGFEHLISLTESYESILGLMGKETDYSRLGGLYKQRSSVAESAYKSSIENYKLYLDEYSKLKKEYDAADVEAQEALKPSLEAAREAVHESQQTMLDDAEAWLETMQLIRDNAIAAAQEALEKGLFGGKSADEMNDYLDSLQAKTEDYLTETNQQYETQKMIRTAMRDIEKTENEAAKRKLENFKKETTELQKQSKLSNFELEVQQAKYELLLAEIALQEAQDAKSTVRLRRDAEGNFNYVYTADQDKVAEAEQKYADAENNLYNIRLEGANEFAEKRVQLEMELSDKIAAIMEDQTLDEEEREARVAELKEDYYQRILNAQSIYNIAAEGLGDNLSEAWSTDMINMIGSTAEMEQNFNTYISSCSEAYKTWQTDVDTASKLIEENYGDVDEAVENVTSEVEKLRTDGRTYLSEAAKDVTQWATVTNHAVNESIKLYRDLLTLILRIKEEQGGVSKDINYMARFQSSGNVTDAFQNLLYREKKLEKYPGAWDDNITELAKEVNNERTYIDAAESLEAAAAAAARREAKLEYLKRANVGVYNELVSKYPETTEQLLKDAYIRLGATEEQAQAVWDKIEKDKAILDSMWDTRDVSLEDLAKSVQALNTGGYTGDFGPEGKLALLHEKELVLNKQDTENLLDTVDIVRDLIDSFEYNNLINSIAGLKPISIDSVGGGDFLEQEVTIHAEFPNVQDKHEIEDAIENLVLTASQFANRKS